MCSKVVRTTGLLLFKREGHKLTLSRQFKTFGDSNTKTDRTNYVGADTHQAKNEKKLARLDLLGKRVICGRNFFLVRFSARHLPERLDQFSRSKPQMMRHADQCVFTVSLSYKFILMSLKVPDFSSWMPIFKVQSYIVFQVGLLLIRVRIRIRMH